MAIMKSTSLGKGEVEGGTPITAKAIRTSEDKNVCSKIQDSLSRISTFDFMKGLGAIYFTWGHATMYWRQDYYSSILATIYLATDWLGPTLFIVFTVIGTTISIRKRELQGNTKGMFKNGVKKAAILFVIGESMNIMIELMNPNKVGAWHVLGMNMITDIAIIQVLAYGLVKLSKKSKFLLLCAVLVIYPLLLNYCLVGTNYDYSGTIAVNSENLKSLPFVLYFVLFNFDAMSPMLGWLIIILVVSIIYDGFTSFIARLTSLPGDKQARLKAKITGLMRYHNGRLILSGFALLGVAWVLSGPHLFEGIGMGNWIYGCVSRCDMFCPFPGLEGLPLFLLRHFPQNVLFNTGLVTIAFGLVNYVKYVKGIEPLLYSNIVALGQYSLTIFMVGHLLNLVGQLPPLGYLIGEIIVLVPMILGFRALVEETRGVGSIEWVIALYSKALKLR